MKFKPLLINLSFLAVWVISMALVYNQNYAGANSNNLTHVQTVSSPKIDTQKWYDVTINSRKIGYAMNSYTKSPLGYVFKDYSLLRLPMAGVLREVLMDFYAVVDEDFSIKAFTFGLASGSYSTDIFGTVKDDFLEIKIESGDDVSTLILPGEEGLFLPGVIPLLLASKGFPAGDFSLSSLDPVSLTVTDMLISSYPQEKIKVKEETYNAYRLEVTSSGITSTMWVTEDGTVVKEEETAGMEMVLTSRNKALDIPDTDPQWDILKSLAVQTDRKIDSPRDVFYMKAELTGIEPAGFNLADDFQKVVSVLPLVVEINPAGFPDSSLSCQNVKSVQDYLKPESFIQSNDRRIINQAKKIIGDIADDSSKAAALAHWVYDNIEKDFAISLPSALEVLRVKRGDCNEHASLFTALTRASDIPTKICLGIVYSEGMFYYHAWSAVYINNRWQPVDPTFDQLAADATHIKLLEGSFDSQANLMRVVGKLRVKIIDYSTLTEVANNR